MPTVSGLSNDNFANAFVLTGASGVVTGNSTGATAEVGEPYYTYNPASKTVWFAWTPTDNGTVVFDTSGTSYDGYLEPYFGATLAGLTYVNPTTYFFYPDNNTKITFAAVAGRMYKIPLGTTNSVQHEGPYTIAWNQTITAPPPPVGPVTPINDTFTGSGPLTAHAADSTQTWTAVADNGAELMGGYLATPDPNTNSGEYKIGFVSGAQDFDLIVDFDIVTYHPGRSPTVGAVPSFRVDGLPNLFHFAVTYIPYTDQLELTLNGATLADSSPATAMGPHRGKVEVRDGVMTTFWDGVMLNTTPFTKPIYDATKKLDMTFSPNAYGATRAPAFSRVQVLAASSAALFWKNFIKCRES